jgi:hypothetical protein
MFLETLESLCRFYDSSDIETRDVITERECKKCMMLREPVMLRIQNAHWIWYCLSRYLQTHFTITPDLAVTHKELLYSYLGPVMNKDILVSEEADVGGSLESKVNPGGFLVLDSKQSPPESEDIEWMHMVTAGPITLWRRRFVHTDVKN